MNPLAPMVIAGFSLLLMNSTAAARGIKFSPAKSFSSGISNPACIATGDFDGDGHPDFAITNHFNQLAIFLGKGDGTFTGPVIYTLDFYVQGCVAAGDFNDDGKPDLVVSGGGHGLALLTGRGDGTFNTPVYFNTNLGGASISLGVGDLNNDGELDIFIGGNGSSEVVLGNGKGNFREEPLQPVSGFSVALGDFNGDGKLDVATTSPFSQTLSVLLGNGDGTFQAPQGYNTLSQCIGVVAGDFNQDNKLDLAVTIDSVLLIFLGNGDGTFTNAGLWFGGNSPVNIVAADFNKDGRLDLAMPDFTGDGVTVVTGQGNGMFPTALDVPTGANPAYVATADFNHDGSLDLVVANFGDGTVSVSLNEGGSFMDVAVSEEESEADERLTLNVTVRGSVLSSVVPSGAVEFKDGGRLLGRAQLKDGMASLTIADLDTSLRKIEVIYSGERIFNPNKSTVLIGADD
jgi:VCBS repeat protein/Big-like domain-containing protein